MWWIVSDILKQLGLMLANLCFVLGAVKHIELMLLLNMFSFLRMMIKLSKYMFITI